MKPTFTEVIALVKKLRSECAWCQDQTFSSLTQYVIEEAYEVAECLQQQQMAQLPDELGDLLFQVLFLAQIAQEQGNFDIDTVLTCLDKKHRERSPHVFANKKATSADHARQLWDQCKPKKTEHPTLLSAAKKPLPPLLKAYQLQSQAAAAHFDWPDTAQVMDKLDEEIEELKEAMTRTAPSIDAIEDEIGDVLFTCVNLARKLNINPSDALNKTNAKFTKRFQYIEQHAREKKTTLVDMSLESMEELWQKAKQR